MRRQICRRIPSLPPGQETVAARFTSPRDRDRLNSSVRIVIHAAPAAKLESPCQHAGKWSSSYHAWHKARQSNPQADTVPSDVIDHHRHLPDHPIGVPLAIPTTTTKATIMDTNIFFFCIHPPYLLYITYVVLIL